MVSPRANTTNYRAEVDSVRSPRVPAMPSRDSKSSTLEREISSSPQISSSRSDIVQALQVERTKENRGRMSKEARERERRVGVGWTVRGGEERMQSIQGENQKAVLYM